MKLAARCKKIGSGATPRGGKSVYQESGIALIRSQNVYHDGFRDEGLAFINENQAAELANVEVRPGDVLLNITGDSVARACVVPTRVLPARVNQHVAIIRPEPAALNPRFLHFWLTSAETQQHLFQLASAGATRKALTKGMIEDLELPNTPKPEQDAIARLLGALDDRIELNRRTNHHLEDLLQTLYDHYFPFTPEEKLPQGWNPGCIGDLCEVAIGGDWGEDNAFEKAQQAICLRGVDLEHLRRVGTADAPKRWLKRTSLAKRLLDDRDVLIAGSGLGPCGRPLWSGLLHRLFNVPVTYSNFCKRLRARTPEDAVFLDRVLHLMRQSEEIWNFINGTSIPNLDAHGLLAGARIVIPPADVRLKFYNLANPIYTRLFAPESSILAAIRETLLPKLLSGEIRLPQAEKIMEAKT